MFTASFDAETKDYLLIAAEGEQMPVRASVWTRLRDPDMIFSEWKQLLQKWAIHQDKAQLLKTTCPTDAEYRALRTVIRTFMD